MRYQNNDYAVPVAYGYRDVWVRGYVDRVVIGCGAEVIARHRRSYEREDMMFEPTHYLPLIERKLGALDQAAPLAGLEDLHAAIKDALRLGAVGFDAVKHLALYRVEKRAPKLDLDAYPYLPKANVTKTSAAGYMCLLSEDAA